jgi:carboxymethylenebutenolidase
VRSMSEPVSIETPDGTMPSHLWRPASGSGPGILLLQEIFGISRYVERRGQDLADLGYVVLAPEIFWRLGVSRVEEGPDALTTALGLLERVDWRAAVADGVLALDALQERAEVTTGAGIVGFCFGGGLGFDVAAQRTPDVLVSYYGSALPELLGITDADPHVEAVGAGAVSAPSLHHFGMSDQFLTRPVVESVRDALQPLDQVTFVSYEGADHAFDNPDFHLYDEAASRLAWGRTTDWLADHLPA